MNQVTQSVPVGDRRIKMHVQRVDSLKECAILYSSEETLAQ
jgi:hypothetical protein